MKKVILISVLALGVAGTSAFARDYDRDSRYDRDGDRHVGYVSPDVGRRVDHLNRMLDHVRWEARQTPTGFRLHREIEHVSYEVNRVNDLYRRGIDPFRLNRKIDSVRAELHNIEVRLNGRNRDWFRWD